MDDSRYVPLALSFADHMVCASMIHSLNEHSRYFLLLGRGIIHQEYHSKKFTKEGGKFEMCQLW